MRRWFIRILLATVIIGCLLAIGAAIYIYPRYMELQRIADGFDLDEIHRIPAISEIFDNNGQRYSRLDGEVRYVVRYDEISPNFINALIAREDNDFYGHHGVDLKGIARAAFRNLRAGEVKEGASTITQQLARNTFDLGEDKWRRKLIEALLAIRIEQKLSKKEILEAYSNRIFYGVGLYGVETAARACFGKSAKDLSLSEAAILAGLIRSPNRLSPLEDTRTALRERDQVLAQMEMLGMITSEEAKVARAEDVPLRKKIPPSIRRNYAIDAVMRDLAILLPEETIRQGGLRIYTTIDRRLQLIAEETVDADLAKIENAEGWEHPRRNDAPPTEEGETTPYLQGALVAIDNTTGGILAMVGGRNYVESPYNRAILARRQIGSTFKPFVYAAAFERGLLPGQLVDDAPLTAEELGGIKWSPGNSDGENMGPTPASVGLIRSRNTMTVRVGEFASRSNVRHLAANAGLGQIPEGPAIYLGAFETELKDLTAAYTMFPNGGVRRQPYIIDHIVDRKGDTIYKATEAQLRCLSPAVAFEMNRLLQDVIRKGTAASAKSLGLTIPAGGKTGTTDDYKDAWFIGYSSRLTCGVWVGLDQPQRIASRAYGSRMALPIWVHFIEEASSFKYDAKDFPADEPVCEVRLCRVSGMRATAECGADAYLARLPLTKVPSEFCTAHTKVAAGQRQGNGTVPVARAVAVADPAASAGQADAANLDEDSSVPVLRAQPVDRAPEASEGEEPPDATDNYRIVPILNGHRFEYVD